MTLVPNRATKDLREAWISLPDGSTASIEHILDIVLDYATNDSNMEDVLGKAFTLALTVSRHYPAGILSYIGQRDKCKMADTVNGVVSDPVSVMIGYLMALIINKLDGKIEVTVTEATQSGLEKIYRESQAERERIEALARELDIRNLDGSPSDE